MHTAVYFTVVSRHFAQQQRTHKHSVHRGAQEEQEKKKKKKKARQRKKTHSFDGSNQCVTNCIGIQRERERERGEHSFALSVTLSCVHLYSSTLHLTLMCVSSKVAPMSRWAGDETHENVSRLCDKWPEGHNFSFFSLSLSVKRSLIFFVRQ